ncbi:MAG: zinc ribbon domain-containing protein [Chloroflexi bacterium]|nr:zinc ribbon domain-containing protein [Chloroflexota bacterium]
MPLYEYRCSACHRHVTILVRDSSRPLACPDCGSTGLSRLFSRFAIVRSEQAAYDDILSDSQLVKGLENDDPRALAEWNRKMSGETSEAAPEYKEMLSRMEAGESPVGGAKTSEEH